MGRYCGTELPPDSTSSDNMVSVVISQWCLWMRGWDTCNDDDWAGDPGVLQWPQRGGGGLHGQLRHGGRLQGVRGPPHHGHGGAQVPRLPRPLPPQQVWADTDHYTWEEHRYNVTFSGSASGSSKCSPVNKFDWMWLLSILSTTLVAITIIWKSGTKYNHES